MITDFEFSAGETTLRGRLHRPETDEASPALVMAPGFTATTRFPAFDAYAAGLAGVGVAVLAFDLRGFGESDGEPRRQLNPWLQAQDYVAALAALRATEGIDEARVGVWGVSLSGAIASVVAASDPRVAAAVLVVPAYGDELTTLEPGAGIDSIRAAVMATDLSTLPTTMTDAMPVVSADPAEMPALLQADTAHPWFIENGGGSATGWVNEASFARIDVPAPFDAAACVPHIAAPTLMVIAEEDEMEGADADVARAVFSTAAEPKTLATVGGGHFGVISPGTDHFDRSLAAQQAFVRTHLLG